MNKKTFLISFLLSIIVLTPIITLAIDRNLEIKYPTIIPTINPPQTAKTILPDYVRYMITAVFIFSGMIIFGSILFAGFLYMTAGSNPSGLSEAKSRIFSSLIGAIILLSSYLVLNTINPTLIQLKIGAPSSVGGGVQFTDANGNTIQSYNSINDFDLIQDGFVPISVEFSSNELDVIPCFKDNLEDCQDETIVGQKDLVVSLSGGVSSAVVVWRVPGVYLYPEQNFQGKPSVYMGDQGDLGEFDNKTQSLKIINSDKQAFYAVLHQDPGFKGECITYDTNAQITDLGAFNKKASAVTVFVQKKDVPASGNGVTLYKKPDYQGYIGLYRSGSVNFTDGDDPNTSGFDDQTNLDSNALVIGKNNNVNSIKIEGDFLAALFEKNNLTGKCEVFKGNNGGDSDLGNNEIGNCRVRKCLRRWGGICLYSENVENSCVSSFIVIGGTNWVEESTNTQRR